SRELDIHQHDVRLKRTRLSQGALGVLGLANDGEIVLVGQERDEPLAKERMVVNQEESQGRHARSPFSFVAWGWWPSRVCPRRAGYASGRCRRGPRLAPAYSSGPGAAPSRSPAPPG